MFKKSRKAELSQSLAAVAEIATVQKMTANWEADQYWPLRWLWLFQTHSERHVWLVQLYSPLLTSQQYWCCHQNLNIIQQQQRPFNGLWSGTTRVGRYQKKHSPTHTHPVTVLPLSSFSICNGPWHPLYSTYVLHSPHVQPLSRSSLVFPLVLNPPLHAPYISSPSHSHLFATHSRTSTACSAAIPMYVIYP